MQWIYVNENKRYDSKVFFLFQAMSLILVDFEKISTSQNCFYFFRNCNFKQIFLNFILETTVLGAYIAGSFLLNCVGFRQKIS
jgi:hypothetical protein